MRKTLLAFLIVLWTTTAFAGEDDEIVVRLETDVKLLPLYLGSTVNENAGFDSAYLSKIEGVLHFDLNHNGTTYVVKKTPQKDSLSNFENLNSTPWRNQNIYYVVLPKVKEQKLSVRILTVNNNVLKVMDDISLTGDLSQDRRTVHQLADTIHKAIFGTEGIATTKILYTTKSKNWSSDVWEADYDGGNARQITKNAGYCITPAYVPPKQGRSTGSFFYVSYLNGQPKIFYASLKDGKGRRFSLLSGNQLMPALSRQRNSLAFISDVKGNPDLFLQTLDPDLGTSETPRQIFAAYQAVQGTPTFSPDGQKIAFVSNKDGAARIYVMPIPPANARLLDLKPKLISKQNRESTAPSWSPDGTKLAYCALTNGVRQIWIYDFEKNEEKQVTDGSGNKENPSWAPNSLHLVYNSTGRGESELYLINLHQPQATKITSGSGEKHYPCWEPRQ